MKSAYSSTNISHRGHTKTIRGVLAFVIFAAICVMTPGMTAQEASAAENTAVDFEAQVSPVLQLVIEDANINLSITPQAGEAVFVNKNLPITVATNNPTGYKLLLQAPSTKLTRNASYVSDGIITTPVMETLGTSATGYTQENFTTNRWGYKLDSGNYMAFSTNIELENATTTTSANGTTRNLSFAAKADMTQPAGDYDLALTFVAVANMMYQQPKYIQDLNNADCANLTGSSTYSVIDKRDDIEYSVKYLNGRCWMTDNLVIAPGTTLTSELSNLSGEYTWTVPADSTTNFSPSTGYTTPGVHAPTDGDIAIMANNNIILTKDQVGMWYNYCAATAGTICMPTSDANVQDEATQDICPKGWRLPAYSWTPGSSAAASFNAVQGGYYNGSAPSGTTNGYWWSSTAYNATYRRYLIYNGSSLYTGYYDYRYFGRYVRCVAAS